MEPFHLEQADMILGAHVDDDYVIQLRMSGNLSEENLTQFGEWAEKVREAMRFVAAKDPKRVLTLIDVRGAEETDEKATMALHELMNYNKDYATRTAVFGASYFIRMIIELAIKITKRSNMKVFPTHEKAVEWLFAPEQEQT